MHPEFIERNFGKMQLRKYTN